MTAPRTPIPDDLPRSPTGRVPQWVVDEAAGRRAVETAWRAPVTPVRPRRARRMRRVPAPLIATLLGVVLAVGWWLDSGTAGFGVGAGSGSDVAQAPAADVVALAGEAHLSDRGRQLLYESRPQLLDAAAFAGQCTDDLAAVRSDGAVGCFRPVDGSVVVYSPTDPRLRGFVVETVAHETLHVGWETLSEPERAELAGLLEVAVATIPADDPIHQQIAFSVGDHPEHRPTELFAYLGTQVWGGGFGERVEEFYARFVADRAALVAVHEEVEASMSQLRADIDAGYQAVLATEFTEGIEAAAAERARIDAMVDDYNALQAQLQP